MKRIEEALAKAETVEQGSDESLPSKDDVGTYLSEFISAFGDLLENPASAVAIARMAAVEKSLTRLQATCSSHPQLRPTIAKHRAVAQSLATLTKLWPTYAEALRAPTLEEAKRLADKGQAVIDAAVEEIRCYEDLVESTRAYEDLSIPDWLDRTLKALSISHPEFSLLDLDRLGAQEAEAVANVPADSGHGAQYLVLDAVASIHLDVERFRAVIEATSRLCANNPRLAVVSSEAGALESLAGSSRLLYEAITSFEAVLLREKDEEALMRRFIKFYGEVYEDVAGPLLAWYCLVAGIKNQSYQKLLQTDVAALARSITQHAQTSSFLEDAGANLRNAAQHGSSFVLNGDQVTFNLRSYQETLSSGQVIDHVFSFLESAAAMSWSLSNALTQAGRALPLKDSDAAYMNLSPLRLATIWLKDRGTIPLKVEGTDTSWDFTIQEEPKEIFELALALSTGVPENISEVSVRSPHATSPLQVPFSAYEQLRLVHEAESDPVDHLHALLELRHACRVDGHSLLDVADLKFATGTSGIFLLLKEDLDQIPYLRRTRQLALSLGKPEVADVISQIFSQNRAPNPAIIRRLAGKLNRWIEKYPAPAMPQSDLVTVYK